MPKIKNWQPLLEGSLAIQAKEAVFAIAENLDQSNLNNPSLYSGKSGIALLYQFIASTYSRPDYEEKSAILLENAIDSLAQKPMSPALYFGFTGVAFVMELLRDKSASEDDPCESIDEALLEILNVPMWEDSFDLLSGLVGFGVYALERLPNKNAKRCLQIILSHLETMVIVHPEGVGWHTEEHCNLGLAHGTPGVIAFLSRLYRSGIEKERVTLLVKRAISWLLSQKISGASSSFPDHIFKGKMPTPSRTAWCYGDLSIAVILLGAARTFNEILWEKEAISLAKKATSRPLTETGVNDAGLCHGAGGVSHLFHRMYQATGDKKFEEAAIFWIEQTLSKRVSGEGIGGFLVWHAKEDGQIDWISLPGFLMGSCGIALTLLAAISTVEPIWDRALLLSPLDSTF